MTKKQESTKRVALYVRVSTGEQTTDNQRLELERVARRSGWHATGDAQTEHRGPLWRSQGVQQVTPTAASSHTSSPARGSHRGGHGAATALPSGGQHGTRGRPLGVFLGIPAGRHQVAD